LRQNKFGVQSKETLRAIWVKISLDQRNLDQIACKDRYLSFCTCMINPQWHVGRFLRGLWLNEAASIEEFFKFMGTQ
jgi:hypothetical protein